MKQGHRAYKSDPSRIAIASQTIPGAREAGLAVPHIVTNFSMLHIAKLPNSRIEARSPFDQRCASPRVQPPKAWDCGLLQRGKREDIAGGHQDYPRQHQKVTDHTPLEWWLPDHEKSSLAFAQHN